jgi:hypothetical protein
MSNFNENQQVIQTDYYRLEFGTKSSRNGDIELGLTTPSNHGINIYKNGNCDIAINGTMKEISGFNIKDSDSPGRIIESKNGSILLQALNGSIVLKAKNIRLIGLDGEGGEITIQGSKIIHMNAPTINAQSDGKLNLSSSGDVNVIANNINGFGHTSCSWDDGPSIDSSSAIGKILKIVKDVQGFFNVGA